MGRILAAVDIGSNTVHQLIAEVVGSTVRKISDESDWLSLGEVVSRQSQIPTTLQDQLVQTLDKFKRQAGYERAEGIYVFATEAVRVARNNSEVLKRIEREVGIKVDLVSGQREAELGLRGAMIDSASPGSMMLIEVGGGSAQIAHAIDGQLESDVSLPLGTGTLTANHFLTCPCDKEVVDKLSQSVRKSLKGAGRMPKSDSVVACGGVARGLWRALHPDGGRTIAAPELDYLVWSTQNLAPEVIAARFQVKAKRAATLLPGAVVFREALNLAGHDSFLVSRFGVREGAVLEMAEGHVKFCPV